MKRNLLNHLVVLTFLAATSAASAWDSTGHQIVAAIARQHLTSQKARDAFDQLVKDFKNDDQGTYDNASIANWMDDIRQYQAIDFSQWHFIDIGLPGEGHDESTVVAARDDVNENVVTGLKRALAVLDGGSDALIKDKAQALAMVCHLVGDLHQPLHCVTHYFKMPIEIGGKQQISDRGGNEVSINSKAEKLPGGKKVPALELHSFWDGAYRLVYDDTTADAVLEEDNVDVTTRGPKDPAKPHSVPRVIGHDSTGPLKRVADVDSAALPQGIASTFHNGDDFEKWAKETYAIAVKSGYGPLQFGQDDPNHLKTVVDKAYCTTARSIGTQQLKLAGLRLASLLDAVLGK